jgi:glycosyltransferase involved in cell wall biosynthesis
MACARPILVAAEGAPRLVVEQAGCGIGCAPEDAEAMAHAILRAYSDRGELANMASQGRRAYLANFSEASVVPRLVDMIHQVAQEGSS